jgi:SAM-dependent methyltransferase
MKDVNNWQTFFDHHAPSYGAEPFTKGTEGEVEFLVRHLGLSPGQRVLDLGCGTGRHAIALATRGLEVTGVDISAGMLREAGHAAQAAGVSVEWIHSPAQGFSADARFDAAYSVCEGALCLLAAGEPFDRDLGVLQVLHRALKPGGRGMVTVLNGMRLLRCYNAADVDAGRFDPSTLIESGAMPVQTPAGPQQVATRERGYVPSELHLLLRLAGFSVRCIGGGTAGNWRLGPPDLDEMEILALFDKPPRP